MGQVCGLLMGQDRSVDGTGLWSVDGTGQVC